MPGAKRRTPIVVVREPRAALLSAEQRQRAVTALTVMIHEWRLGDRGRSADAVGGSGKSDDAAAGASPEAGQGMRRRTAGSVTIGP
jgi:hypothetical protein